MRYTTVKLYQPVPLTCNQLVQLPYNQFVPELNMYQPNTTDTGPVVLQHAYVRALYIQQNAYVHILSVMQPAYTL
jgi:hypothetical protein